MCPSLLRSPQKSNRCLMFEQTQLDVYKGEPMKGPPQLAEQWLSLLVQRLVRALRRWSMGWNRTGYKHQRLSSDSKICWIDTIGYKVPKRARLKCFLTSQTLRMRRFLRVWNPNLRQTSGAALFTATPHHYLSNWLPFVFFREFQVSTLRVVLLVRVLLDLESKPFWRAS